MDSNQPPPQHRTTDLFICFTASMKSILSPGRTGSRDQPVSLSTSLSRRLRTSRSIKGAASPAMFPTTGKKRSGAGGFENPEPSSPKVTCIGQVRVKTKKKQAKKLRTNLSRRHSNGANDISFRKLQRFGSVNHETRRRNGNQRWVHLPLTICEALREFSCLFPCRNSCFSPAKDSGRGVAGDIELEVRDDDEEDDEHEDDISFRASRRHVFDDLEIVNGRIEGCDYKDESRVSICIPPKNALLLMRCRSDPLKMEALANRLWDSTKDEEEDFDEDGDLIYYEDQIQEKMVDSNENQEQIIENNEEEEEIMFLGLLFEEIEGNVEEQEEEIPETETEEVKGFEEEMVTESKERENEVLERESLPECLLLMMCEPKLSMEVSKETWVCSKDFIRRQPSRKKPPAPVKSTAGQDESKVSVPTAPTIVKYDDKPAAIQPSRSSCSLPAPPSMAEMLEQKLVNAVGYEPFVLTRCKSEPMRMAASKLAPDSCFWKNRKLEPLRRASFGVGAAGLGF